ncbi:uncharacterized protein LOC124451158 [Xenia sp. Carnegie-2017]|uniref:uncharacterized protein LOC124451158 n=1 Tax=Xenia sp. Carnegie-2017 TaxID=2897299 RepID=UPI001F03DA6C|nr:uncharacterized protein LOC124451158 [Xenia sp. Carnegie-2017]
MEKYEFQRSIHENIRKLNDKQVDFSEVVQEKWLEKEVELNKMLKIILAKRKELLNKRKENLSSKEKKANDLSEDFETAKIRNRKLIEEIETFERSIRHQEKKARDNSTLEDLKAMFWKCYVTAEQSYLHQPV